VHQTHRTYTAVFTGYEPGRSDAVRLALKWAAEQTDSGDDLLVIAPQRSSFRDDEVLSHLPASIRQETMRTMRTRIGARIVVACWPTREDLDRIDTFTNMKALCVVPWIPEEIDVWRATRGATSLTDAQPPPVTISTLDPVVEEALRSLTTRVNVSTGIGHPSDMNSAISMFRILQRGAYEWELDAVQVTAIRLGWDADDAKDLADIAEKVTNRHRFHNVTSTWATDILMLWQDRSAR